MNPINYLRVAIKMQCGQCGFGKTDFDFKVEHEVRKVSESLSEYVIKTVCPECGTVQEEATSQLTTASFNLNDEGTK